MTNTEVIIHNLTALKNYGNIPESSDSAHKVRLIDYDSNSNLFLIQQVASQAASKEFQLIPLIARTAAREKYETPHIISALAYTIYGPGLDKVGDLSLLTSAKKGLNKFIVSQKNDAVKDSLIPIWVELDTRIRDNFIKAVPKHHMVISKKSTLKNVAAPLLLKPIRSVSFNTEETIFPITPNKSLKETPRPSIAAPMAAPKVQLPKILTPLETRCQEILQSGQELRPGGSRMQELIKNLELDLFAFEHRHRLHTNTPNYKETVNAYKTRIQQLREMCLKNQIVYTGIGPTCYYDS